MTFAFEIISAREIHRDLRGDSYRHWTLLIGVLQSGIIKMRDDIAIPSQGEKPLVANIIGLEPNINDGLAGEELLMKSSRAFSQEIPDFMRRRGKLWSKQSSRKQIKASEINQPFMVVIWEPACNPADIQIGAVATECTDEFYQSRILEMLHLEPERILHCRDCAAQLSNIPEAMPYLKELLVHPDRELVKRAVGIYNYLHWQLKKD
ncbi:hypothetical protein [Brunnivagina elsteri]|uniref:Uncharacterized protein n=1 Tax=Brunnivagina elsteri CCALA 953 TaxID=987040 RepID=A0A2A2TGY7_9CYAN|nr:hypothetical protein [Calothrix elsteri]PAX52993.1 hypothetical protein CK510_16295 [Calothrix elsteri CCALA 953]